MDFGVSLFPGAAGNDFSGFFSPGWARRPLGMGLGGGRGVMCAHKHFGGPSPTSRHWEKFTYPAHFHMSWLRLAEATICAAARRSGFFPAPERVGFFPRGCFVAAARLSLVFFPFPPFPVLHLFPCLLPLPSSTDGTERNPNPPPSVIPKPSGESWRGAKLSFKQPSERRTGGKN